MRWYSLPSVVDAPHDTSSALLLCLYLSRPCLLRYTALAAIKTHKSKSTKTPKTSTIVVSPPEPVYVRVFVLFSLSSFLSHSHSLSPNVCACVYMYVAHCSCFVECDAYACGEEERKYGNINKTTALPVSARSIR